MKLVQFLLNEKVHPSKGLTKKERSAIVKKAKAGEDIGEPGKKFKEIAAKAAKRYGSEEAGRRVAGAALWAKMAKEDVEYTAEEILDIVDELATLDEKSLEEKWARPAVVPEREKGKHAGKTLEELRKELTNAKKRGDTDRVRELNFAIRAKTGWGRVN